MKERYKEQVGLLLDVLPFVAEEGRLALHGGTAINLFVREMPRLSVDIDLTYLPVQDREASLNDIKSILLRIKANVESDLVGVKVQPKLEKGKLLIARDNALIKLEVNLVGRGVYQEPQPVVLCDKAQNEYDAFVEINMVSKGQLYGGKICAALDRQHPRDLFDIKYMLGAEGFSDELKAGFIYCILGSERPMYELLNPHRLDQHEALENQFDGMSDEPFTYTDYQATRELLVEKVQGALTEKDKAFLLGFKRLEPDWSLYDYKDYPSVKWKILNLNKLKSKNPAKYEDQYKRLEKFLAR